VDRVPDSTQIRQLKSVEIRGGMGEWTFGAAGNFDNRIYIGASVGIPTVNYEEQSYYSEKEVYDTISSFEYFSFDQYLQTKGRGINFKAGVIFRPFDFLRLGVAFHSPSSLKLTDSYFSKMSSILGDTVRYAESPTGSYRYSIRTPMRVIGSVAFVAGKMAVVSFDYELVDYSDGRLKSQDYAFFDENAAVRAKYKSASNIRGGIEFRMLPFSLRAGFAYYGSPYQETVNNEVSRLYITGGAGYRDPKDVYYVDIGFISQRYTENYYFYDQSLVDPVENKWKSINIMITFGLRFGEEPPKSE
jgi:long-subunit fatty acid transport protein